ncbi:MAG: DUF1853 family protein, partial [Crocinitomicaceae bacterium]|nr:DUF1853 family protein [Crocinitomicaceae bacterium]
MNPHKEIANYQQQHVKNLVWLLLSPSPIAENGIIELPQIPQLWCEKWYIENKSFLLHLDANSKPLMELIENSRSKRMGIYAELLLGYFFEHAPSIRLLLQNFQVIDEHGVTLGEIDFILEWQEQVIHLELSLKYYLCYGEPNDFSHWIGPSGNDHLALKIQKVLNHQLPIVRSNLFREHTNIFASSYMFLRGCFFSRDNNLPDWKNSKLPYAPYFFFNEVEGIKDYIEDDHCYWLPRPNWLADNWLVHNPSSHLLSEILELSEKKSSPVYIKPM